MHIILANIYEISISLIFLIPYPMPSFLPHMSINMFILWTYEVHFFIPLQPKSPLIITFIHYYIIDIMPWIQQLFIFLFCYLFRKRRPCCYYRHWTYSLHIINPLPLINRLPYRNSCFWPPVIIDYFFNWL